MCSECFNVGYIDQDLGNGKKLKHACPTCNRAEDSRNREPRRQPGWLTRLADKPGVK
ncbi:hypothetical protein ACSNOK_20700 [Streptomyces sp. URMC 126]|uniref:hypothetical protein n=1 Tax=Streptomyces sp. URMC 126 TaxID=3423401 RepID=UPI003F1DFFCA